MNLQFYSFFFNDRDYGGRGYDHGHDRDCDRRDHAHDRDRDYDHGLNDHENHFHYFHDQMVRLNDFS